MPDIFQFPAMAGIFSYFTFASTGYIIHSKPMAIGSETVSNLMESRAGPKLGKTLPRPIPTAIARNIHSGRKRSNVDNRPATPVDRVKRGAAICDIALILLK